MSMKIMTILPIRPSAKGRSDFMIAIWAERLGWRWAIPGDATGFSEPYPTREAAIDAARSREGRPPQPARRGH